MGFLPFLILLVLTYFQLFSGKLAKQYLSVQATSAPSERVFSAAERVIGTRRGRLSPEMAGRLLFVSRNWDNYLGQMSLQEALDQIMVGPE